MTSLTWSQVNTWRVSQQYLHQRPGREMLLEVVGRLGGIQAQLMSAAELALAARLEGLEPADVENALWRDRTLVKTWAMRGTLHLLRASEFPLYIAARSEQLARTRRPPSYYKYHGVTPDELDAIIEGVPQVLGEEPMTREQLADALAERAGRPHLRDALLSGWGALLKPSAWRGELCFGPNQGQKVTFVRPRDWLGNWQPVDGQAALQEIARRYLNTYGPATTDDFARWWGLEASHGKKLFRSLGDEIESVEVEGWEAWALASTLATMQTIEPTRSVRLLPQFDAYVVGIARDCEPVLPQVYKARVYRPQGWISAVVLVEGRMQGVWEHETRGSRIVLKVDLFEPVPDDIQDDLQAEARRVGEFLGSEVEFNF